MEDLIEHPSHYTNTKIETLDFIDDKLGLNREYYYIGNILKYISRYQFKNGVEDLKKAEFYLKRIIKYKEEE